MTVRVERSCANPGCSVPVTGRPDRAFCSRTCKSLAHKRRQRAATDPSSNPTIYFIQQGMNGPIKIGWTKVRLANRIARLQCGNPVPLYLLRSEPGTRQDEKALHRRFERFHIRGEWFYPEVWSFL